MKPLVIASPNGHFYRNGGDATCVETAFSLMTSGTDVLDALIAGVNLVELDPEESSVGYGGLPNAEGVVLIILPEMRYQLGVAMGDQAMALRLERAFHLGIVKDLAVEQGNDAGVFVPDWLVTVSEPDYAQAAAGQGQCTRFEEAFAVGAAMNEGIRHTAQSSRRDDPSARKIHDARDAAH